MIKKQLLLTLITALAVAGPVAAQDKDPNNGGATSPNSSSAPLGGGLPGTTCSGALGNGCSQALPDNTPAGVSSSFDLNFCGTVNDINIGIDTTHTWVGDLIYTVQSPMGTSVTIVDQPGVPASAFGCMENDIFAVLDDAGATPVENECVVAVPAISGTFSPNNPLSAFNGEDPNGTWTLTVSDNAAGDLGMLNDWSIELDQPCIAPPVIVPTLNTWGIALFVLMLAVAGVFVMRRRAN